VIIPKRPTRPVIVEGLTGTGKSSTIAALCARGVEVWFDEDATFDDFMNRWLADPAMQPDQRTERLDRILAHVEAGTGRMSDAATVIERFHLSYAALDDDWAVYERIDHQAAKLGIALVLLDLPDELLAERCLYRREFGRTDWQSLSDIYGSEADALEALRVSQQRRRHALARTQLEHITIDTAAMAWTEYAAQIHAFANA